MRDHPYRTSVERVPSRHTGIRAWTIALALVWITASAYMIAVAFDRALAGPLTGLAIVLAVGVPVFVANARVLGNTNDDA